MTPFVHFYRRGSDTYWASQLIAIVELDEDGVAVLNESTEHLRKAPAWIMDRFIGDDGGEVVPEEGERFLRALPANSARRTSHAAVFHEPIGVLIEALRDAGHDDLARRVEADRDRPFRSPVEEQRGDELVAALRERGEVVLAERVEAGRYEMSQDEMEAWEESGAEQQALAATAIYSANRRRAEREARESGG